MPPSALIVGAGSGISASFARRLAKAGYAVTLASRTTDDLAPLCAETAAHARTCDATDAAQVEELFADIDRRNGRLDVTLFNASFRTRGPLVELEPVKVQASLMTTAFGGFLIGQQAAKRMLARGSGTILFTGASASVKGYPQSAPFAMGKFALRGLAQSMARELGPKGVHVVHAVIDGGVRNPATGRVEGPESPDSLLDPDAIADTYMHVLTQPRNAWTAEIEVRPWVERF
jgi:NAD(P)-dependent dehydrogenase (short-subunit alcohol dehydrogenase family)